MGNNLVPDVNLAIGQGIDALVALKPNALKHINGGAGRYSHLFTGWKSQGNIVASRFADEAISTRLISSGVPLQQLCASEFDAVLPSDPTFSVGEVTLVRSTGTLPAGVIRNGTTFFKASNPNNQPLAITGATYTVSQDIIVQSGQTTVIVPIVASNSGPNANTPSDKIVGSSITLNTVIQPTQQLFDSNFTVSDSHSAGGSQTPNADPLLRRLATANFQGKFGPTLGAITAGALFVSGVANLAVLDNDFNARTVIFPTDESWAYSERLNAEVGQYVRDNSAGFGCSIQMGKTANQFIHVSATVNLFETNDLVNTSPILQNIQDTLTFYFNSRPDWWTWKTNTIAAAIVSADRKIFSATSIVVTDAVTGSTISQPGPIVLDLNNPILQHYYLTDNACNINFLGLS